MKGTILTFLFISLLACNIKTSKENLIVENVGIYNIHLENAIIEYQNEYILNEGIIKNVLLISPVLSQPHKIFEFNATDHPLSFNESNSLYRYTKVQEMPVVFESFYSGTLKLADKIDILNELKPFLKNDETPPSTGYLSDTWYVIIHPDRYEVINYSDSLDLYKSNVNVRQEIAKRFIGG